MTTEAATRLPDLPDILFGGSDPQYRDRSEKSWAKSPVDVCAICGRAVKAGHLVVNTAYGADVIDPIYENAEHPGDSGWFAIGPECARKAGIKAYVR